MANNRKRHHPDQDRRINQNRDHSRSRTQITIGSTTNPQKVNNQFSFHTLTPLIYPLKSKSYVKSLQIHDTAIRVSTEDVEDVLKLSYAYPAAAV
ncbi:hypothetical protein Hanom_Chr10g00914331 [Helianthus anomalus]